MNDRFQLGEGQGIDGRFDNGHFAAFLCIFFMNRTHHFQPHHGGTVFAEDNVINLILAVAFVHKYCAKAFSCNVNGIDDSLIFLDTVTYKSQCLQVDIFLCGKHTKETFIQHCVNVAAHFIINEFLDLLNTRTQTDTQYLAFFTDYQDIGIQDFGQYFADIVEYYLAGIVIMKQLIDFSCFIQ